MKKAAGVLFASLLVFSAVSCKSTQKEIDGQFRDVYDRYRSAIILDGAETYTVQRGDTLTRIARSRYGQGNAFYYPLFLLASNIILDDPDLLEIGTELTIPKLDVNLNNAPARAQIKLFLADVAGIYENTDKRWSREHYEELMRLSNAL